MSEPILFFIDANIMKGEIPLDEIKEHFPTKKIRARFIHKTPWQKYGDSRLVKKVNDWARKIKSGQIFFITRDRDFREFSEENLAPNFHLVRIKLSGEAWFQEERQVQPVYREKEEINPEKVNLIRTEIKEEIINTVEKTLNLHLQ